jgi:hypothetical protein
MSRGRPYVDHPPSENRNVRLVDIAWAAGIYEGEGSIQIQGSKCLAVLIGQKDTWILERMEKLFGGIMHNVTTTQREYYMWRLSGPRALGFLFTIYSFLSPRRKAQFREAFHRQVRVKNLT